MEGTHVADGGRRAGRAPRRIAFSGRWLPVARWTRRGGGVRWDFEAVALPEPARRDSGLLVSMVARATNQGTDPCDAAIVWTLEPPGADPTFVAFDAPPEASSPPLHWGSGNSADTCYGWSPGAHAGPELRESWRLAPRASRSLRIVLPAYPTLNRELARAADRSHGRWVDEARRYWERELDRATRFELGDSRVEAALRAARIVMLSCRERRGPRWVPIGGLFQYRDVWLRDGARVAQALAVTGHTAVARQLVQGLADFQWPQGAFLSQRGQPDGTGQALWAFQQVLLRPTADDSLSRYADAAWRAWAWCESQLEWGRKSRWVFGAMMPYADPRDAELVRAQLVGTDAWSIAGYRAAARLLRASGLRSRADSVDASRERYAQDFERALARTTSPDVPPSWQEVGRDWGNLAVGWPCVALPAHHPRLRSLARRVWSVAGGPGLVTYGDTDSLHYYLGADLGTWALLAGERSAADSVLEALLLWRSASGAAGELFSRRGDFGRNLLPHPTAAAALVSLLRNTLVFDDGDTLQLTLGARAAWWRRARVRDAPTYWGLIDLEFRRRGGSAEWRWTPVPVWTALHLPPGSRVAESPSPPLRRAATGDMVLAPPGTARAQVKLSR
ncbi:MAG TPA: hypothetical protein VGK93_08930 [Candidatus Eisenbacteria bacterium]